MRDNIYDYRGKKVIVIGMGKSGNASVRFLKELGCIVDAYDGNKTPTLESGVSDLINESFFGGDMPNPEIYDLAVIAPGVPPTIYIVQTIRNLNIEILGEVELAYRFASGRFIGITGTNGKTTTTTWLYDVFVRAGKKSYLAGNVGIPLTDMVRENDAEDVTYITELSSYQLESIDTFTPQAAAILNLTPDHLNRHGDMEGYGMAKWNIQKNMSDKSSLIINYDDALLRAYMDKVEGCKFFSKINFDALSYTKDGRVYSKIYGDEPIIEVSDIFLKGEHNLENALAVTGLASICGIGIEPLRESLKLFKGVEHRNEYVTTVEGVACYNDSKATNPEAAIPALKSIDTPIILIAGGMDKGNDYREWIGHFDAVKKALLFGETKYDIAKAMDELGNRRYQVFDDLDQAFSAARDLAVYGDTILLSPACASWDMYKSFEVRGEHFKRLCMEWFKEKNS